MTDTADIVTLRVAGVDYAGWTAIESIRMGLDSIAGGFSISLTEKWPGAVSRPIHKEDACAVRVGGTTVITGQIDEVARSLAEGAHTIRVTGRDATADLIDCAAMNSPGEWLNRSLVDIVAAVCGPFGIKVQVSSGQATGAAFPAFTLQKGEAGFAAIKRACAARGVLPYSDGRGVLLLGPGTPGRAGSRLVEGVNIKEISARDSRIGRFRDYTVYAQSGQWDDADANAGTKGLAHDSGIRRYRPTARAADDLADGVTVADQAAWDAKVGKARAEAVDVTVKGWRHAGGIWRPNTLVTVDAPSVAVSGDRLIASVDLALDSQGGSVARLALVGPGAFDLLAANAKKGPIAW